MLNLVVPGRLRAWEGIVDDPFPERSVKPRRRGLTIVIDKGLGLTETRDLMELAGEYIDYVKLAFGTSALYDRALLRAKIELIRDYRVDVYPGGTFLEVALLQGRLERFVEEACRLGFTALEVSDGTIALSPAERLRAIRAGRGAGLTVLTEIGKKDSSSQPPLAFLREQMARDLEAGVTHVIVEGRESGKGVGVYAADGTVREVDVENLLSGLSDPFLLVWETPLKKQQETMIARFGPDVNLGNIPPQEVLAVEALRRGLRGDTLRLYLERRVGVREP
ncbi:MAG TPA: phosphosulfolactate synthase [Firmicutes bacterium]|nr:phosphosulfolactate synthase [Bacillota bacterium]